MRRIGMGLSAAVLLVMFACSSARATISASATIASETPLPSGGYEYSVSLTNSASSTSSASTFWFGWVAYLGFYPYDFLPSKPTVTSPAGWTGSAQEDGFGVPNGAWGIEWSTTTPLQPGHTATGFVFDTADAPAVINGTSGFAGYPTRESWVYQNTYIGTTNSGDNAEFTPSIAPAPEPTMIVVLPSLLLLGRRRAR
jgi:hypothetical protein